METAAVLVVEGRGLIKGQFLAQIAGDFVPGGPWSTEQQAQAAGEQWREFCQKASEHLALDEKRRAALAAKVKAGEWLSPEELRYLGLRPDFSDVRWFIPKSAALFGLSSHSIRPLIKNMIRHTKTDMGVTREWVPTHTALARIAATLNRSGQ